MQGTISTTTASPKARRTQQIGAQHVSRRSALAIAATMVLLPLGCSPGTTTQTPRTSAAHVEIPVVGAGPSDQALVIGPGLAAAASVPPGAATPTIGTAGVDTWNGWLPDGRTFSPFDTVSQPVTRLDPLLLKAVQDATRAAAAQGVTIALSSGWRSRGFQQRLFADAVRQYGSVELAQQFVASPDTSKHVIGGAVDVTGAGASDWLIRNGAQFGLCQIYANENWHFELAVDGEGRCPPLRPNAAG
jgi:zinc D-Ala-D-Ala carboxypeptidase